MKTLTKALFLSLLSYCLVAPAHAEGEEEAGEECVAEDCSSAEASGLMANQIGYENPYQTPPGGYGDGFDPRVGDANTPGYYPQRNYGLDADTLNLLSEIAADNNECYEYFQECVEAGVDLNNLGSCAPVLDTPQCADIVNEGIIYVLEGGVL